MAQLERRTDPSVTSLHNAHIHQLFGRILVMPRELIHCVVSVYERYDSLTTSCGARTGS